MVTKSIPKKPTSFDEQPLCGNKNANIYSTATDDPFNQTNPFESKNPFGTSNPFGKTAPFGNSSNPFGSKNPFGSGGPPMEEEKLDLTSIPLEKKLTHSKWQAKVAGFEELQKKFETTTSNDVYSEYAERYKKFLLERHPSVQGSIYKSLEAFLMKCPKNTHFNMKTCTKLIIQKGMSARKQVVKDAAGNTLAEIFVYLDDKSDFYSVVNTEIKQKNFKNAINGIQTVKSLLTNLGAKKLGYMKGFYPGLEAQAKIASNPKVKAELLSCYKEIIKWIGIACSYKTLKDYYVTKLDEFVGSYQKVRMIPKRGQEVAMSMANFNLNKG